jgi:hypothetical protein
LNKIFVTSLLLLSVVACGRKQNRNSTICFDYPKQIDSLKVRDLYDSARFYLFTWLCDKEIDNFYRGQFELNFKSFFLQNDSIEFFFLHSLPKELKDANTISDYIHQSSFAFNIKTKQKLWGWDINGFSDALQPGHPRFESSASVEVVNFIRAHEQILNPCFLELARRKKLLEN